MDHRKLAYLRLALGVVATKNTLKKIPPHFIDHCDGWAGKQMFE